MAKIVITYDSETKEVSATINGALVQNINSVSIYVDKYEDEYCYGYCELCTVPKTEEGVTTYTRICAAKDDKSESYLDSGKTLAIAKITK